MRFQVDLRLDGKDYFCFKIKINPKKSQREFWWLILALVSSLVTFVFIPPTSCPGEPLSKPDTRKKEEISLMVIQQPNTCSCISWIAY